MDVPRRNPTDIHDCVPQFSIVKNTGFTGSTSGGKVSEKYIQTLSLRVDLYVLLYKAPTHIKVSDCSLRFV